MSDSNGLYYMRARYYNPEIKRFINQDVLQGNITDGQSMNRYAYVNGNPVSQVDPFGLCAESSNCNSFAHFILGGIEIEILHYNREFKQGFEVSIDQRKGYIEVDGQKLSTPVFWTDTAPRMFSFKCFPKKPNGIMNVWNVWKNDLYKENIDAWVGNAGLYIEKIDDESIIFHCSNGIGNIKFEDLVFEMKIKK